ncbi:hypothetical protein ACHAW5_006310 [Stephanodiscus triporus]|uniref:Response regulatory domain-containing protein n=1 Tax=Stephanodiscus triporus TaxID=2934178 RepID=A0ABD3NNY8_9STRA
MGGGEDDDRDDGDDGDDDEDVDDDPPRWRLPDCVISDIRMPGGIDGIKLLQLMRRPPPPPTPADDDDDDDDKAPLQPRRGRGRPRKDGTVYYHAGDRRDGGKGKDEYDPLPSSTIVVDDGGPPRGGRIITPTDQAAQRIDAIHGCISYLSRRDGTPSRRRRLRPASLRDVPVILLTARAMVSDRIVGYGSGADGYLPKPFRPEELLGMIDNLMRRRGGSYGNDDDGGGGEGGDIVEKGGGDLTTEQAREIADEFGEIKELIRARMGRLQETSTDGNDLKEKLRPLLPEAIWMFRTGERRKRVFTRDHIKSILSSCYGVDLTSKKNAGWENLRKELEGRCSERPERLSCSDMPE